MTKISYLPDIHLQYSTADCMNVTARGIRLSARNSAIEVCSGNWNLRDKSLDKISLYLLFFTVWYVDIKHTSIDRSLQKI